MKKYLEEIIPFAKTPFEELFNHDKQKELYFFPRENFMALLNYSKGSNMEIYVKALAEGDDTYIKTDDDLSL